MQPTPWWTLPSAAAAPTLPFAGWTVAGERQSDGYNGVNDTISELAANGAADRWIMNVTLLAVGLCYVVTAAGLRPVPVAGRAILAWSGRCDRRWRWRSPGSCSYWWGGSRSNFSPEARGLVSPNG